MFCGISTACAQVACHPVEEKVNCFQQNPAYFAEMLSKVDGCFHMYDFKTGLPISRGKYPHIGCRSITIVKKSLYINMFIAFASRTLPDTKTRN